MSNENETTRGPKVALKSGGLTVSVDTYRTDRKDLIPVRKVEKRSKSSGSVVTQKQHIYDKHNVELTDTKTKKKYTDDEGKVYENDDIEDFIDGEVAEPFKKTDIIELRRMEGNPDDYLVDDHYEVVSRSSDQVLSLWKLAQDIQDNGPLYGPAVFRKGHKRTIVIVTSEVDEDKGKFAVLLRTTNSRVRLTRPIDIPIDPNAANVPKL